MSSPKILNSNQMLISFFPHITVYFVNLYVFRAYPGPSSGGTTVCIQELVLIIFLDDCLLCWLDWSNTYIRLYLLMIGLDTAETCRGWLNILRTSFASSWVFFRQLYREARSTKLKIYLMHSAWNAWLFMALARRTITILAIYWMTLSWSAEKVPIKLNIFLKCFQNRLV